MRKMIMAALAGVALVGSAGVAAAQPGERWGHWDPTWGSMPPPPPHRMAYWRHREHQREWYEHAHRCMVHERYDPRRDMYFEHRRWVVCRD